VSDPVWYRSLYWRIALGFVALLATLLAAQGLVFLWLTGRVAAVWPGRSAAELASTIASDLSQELTEHPDTDIGDYVNRRYQNAFRSFAVVMRDGRFAVSRRVLPPQNITRAAGARLFGDSAIAPPPFGRPPGRSEFPPPGDFDRRRGFGRRDQMGPPVGPPPGSRPGEPPRRGPGGFDNPPPIRFEFASILVSGEDAGVVAVPVDPPPLSLAMRDLGPTLGTVALGLLVAGTAVGALLVFRPTHRRLRGLQEAARAVGAGETGVRAPETGGDEVTALARAFNEMAGQLEQRTEALETADRTRRQLVADVSHELSTPLAAIRGYVETLAMPNLPIDDATRARYLQIVTEETERLEHIVGDLLEVGRLEGGGDALSIERVLVTQLFQRLRHRHERLLREKQIQLETTQTPDDLAIDVDTKRLEQVLQNLVSNAVRHTPEGGRIRVSAERIEPGVRIVVQDTGPGISAEHLGRVFDRFYKVDVSRSGTTLPSGSGLGLSIVRAIVERHGGRVTAGNAPEGGARFEIVLPSGS
jgi:signal transduction histidine kinase